MNTFISTILVFFCIGLALASCGPSRDWKPLTAEPTARAAYLNPDVVCPPTPEAWGTANRFERSVWLLENCKVK